MREGAAGMANNKSNVINGTIRAVGSWRNEIEPQPLSLTCWMTWANVPES